MSQYNTGFKAFTAGEDLAARCRVKKSSSTVVYADAGEDFIGVTENAVDSGDVVTVKLKNVSGTFKVQAAGTFSANALLYGAADGKVDDTVAGEAQFFALEAATASTDIVEALPWDMSGAGGPLVISEDVTDAILISGDCSDNAIEVTGAITDSVLKASDTGSTSAHVIDMADGFLGSFVETGTYSSAADKGITLSDSNTRPVSFLFDDSAAALTGNNRAVLSRVYLATDQGSGGTIVSIQGQLKIADNENFTAGRFCGVDGYMEFGGTSSIGSGSYVSAMNARVDVAASKTVTVSSGGYLCGIHVHTTGTGTLTSTGSSYGIYINDQGTVDDWKVGIGIANSTTGVDIGAWTTAVNFSGAATQSHMAHVSKWGESFNYGCMTIAGDQAGTALAWGSATGNVCVTRINMTAQVGTAEGYVIGEYKSYATSGAGTGTVLQYGIWIGDYAKLTLNHNTTDAYATRGRTILGGTLTGNQFIGVMGQVEFTAAATLEATGGGYGVYGSITSSGSGTCNRNVAAGYFTMRPNTINLVGTQSCVVCDMGGSGYADYGLLAQVGNNNVAEAAIAVHTTDSAVLPYAIKVFSTSGSITNLFRFTSASTAPVSSGGTIGTHGTATVKIACDIAGTTYYLLASTVPTFT